jgi:hypothetical protein
MQGMTDATRLGQSYVKQNDPPQGFIESGCKEVFTVQQAFYMLVKYATRHISEEVPLKFVRGEGRESYDEDVVYSSMHQMGSTSTRSLKNLEG